MYCIQKNWGLGLSYVPPLSPKFVGKFQTSRYRWKPLKVRRQLQTPRVGNKLQTSRPPKVRRQVPNTEVQGIKVMFIDIPMVA